MKLKIFNFGRLMLLLFAISLVSILACSSDPETVEVEVIKEVEVEKVVEVEVIKEVEVEKEVVTTEEVISPISYVIIGLGVVLAVVSGVLYTRSKK